MRTGDFMRKQRCGTRSAAVRRARIPPRRVHRRARRPAPRRACTSTDTRPPARPADSRSPGAGARSRPPAPRRARPGR